MVKNMMRLLIIVLICTALILIVTASFLCYRNLHWWEKDMRTIEKLGIWEKQAALPNGHRINYGELEGDGPALLLIHGQMAAWEVYAGTP